MIDYTTVAAQAAVFVLSLASTVFLAWLRSHMKDKQAAAVIGAAITNAIGSVEQATVAGLKSHPLQAQIPGITPASAAGVQYVLDNATVELARYTNITPTLIASKIDAKLGLAGVAANLAVANSNTPVVPAPIGPVPVTQAA
jgi:hypothetical protein